MVDTIQYPTANEPNYVAVNLWEEFLSGNRKALSKLYHKYYKSLFSYGLRIVYNEELIKDCIQELFLYIWEHRTSINPVHSVGSYLSLSLRRVIFVHLRREKSRSLRNREYLEDLINERDEIEDILMNIDDDYNNRSKQIKDACLRLTKRQSEMIQLKYFYGLTTDEICTLLGLKRQSVYNCLSEALSKLQKNVAYND